MASLKEKVRAEGAGNIRNLVFEGGGVWGIAYEGALLELSELGLLDDVKRVAGASAGAITAALLAVGYTPQDLGQLLRRTDFSDFTDDSFGYARDTARLLTEYGWYKGDAFRKWIRKQIRAQMIAVSERAGVSNPPTRPRLSELRAWQGKLARKGVHLPEFFAVASNLSQQKRETYCASTTPKLYLEEAVRGSMSIPLFFACTRGERSGKQRDVIVDGGLTWNYPVNLFDRERYVEDAVHGLPISYATRADEVFNTETLGFRLDTTGELQANLKDWRNEPADIDNVVQYGWALVTFIRAIANKVHLHQNDWSRTVFVDVGEDIGFTDFDLTSEQQDFLSAAGRRGVRKYFEWRSGKAGQRERERIHAAMA